MKLQGNLRFCIVTSSVDLRGWPLYLIQYYHKTSMNVCLKEHVWADMLHTINSINLNWTVGWQLFAKYLIINDNRINYGDTLRVGPHSRSDGKDFRMPNVHGWFSTTLKVLVSVCLHFSETSQILRLIHHSTLYIRSGSLTYTGWLHVLYICY